MLRYLHKWIGPGFSKINISIHIVIKSITINAEVGGDNEDDNHENYHNNNANADHYFGE